MVALEKIREVLGLDYGGVDFGLGPEWRSVAVRGQRDHGDRAPWTPDERWAYRRTAISTIVDAVVAMLMQKSTQARPA